MLFPFAMFIVCALAAIIYLFWAAREKKKHPDNLY